MKYQTGYTGGTFDVLHVGHVNFLAQCKKRCNYLVVSLNTDEFCCEYKRKPIFNYEERMKALWLLQDIGIIDEVIMNVGGADSKPAITSVLPNVIFHGDDWKGKSFYKQLDVTKEWLDEYSICMEYIPYTDGISTSEIIKRLKC